MLTRVQNNPTHFCRVLFKYATYRKDQEKETCQTDVLDYFQREPRMERVKGDFSFVCKVYHFTQKLYSCVAFLED